MGKKIGFTAQRSVLTWKVGKELVRTNWKRNNENQVKIKHETIDFRIAEHRRDLFDLSPELGEVTQPRAVVFSLVPKLCEYKNTTKTPGSVLPSTTDTPRVLAMPKSHFHTNCWQMRM